MIKNLVSRSKKKEVSSKGISVVLRFSSESKCGEASGYCILLLVDFHMKRGGHQVDRSHLPVRVVLY